MKDPDLGWCVWRCVDGRIEYNTSMLVTQGWCDVAAFSVANTVNRIRLWADLLNNPTETMEDE